MGVEDRVGGGGGIEVSAFFACASRCALRPCTRWVAEDGGRRRPQCAGRVSNPRTHDWASSVVPGTPRTRQNPRDSIYVGGRYASPYLSSSSSSSAYHLILLPFSFTSIFSTLVALLPRCHHRSSRSAASYPTFLSFLLPFFSLSSCTQLSGSFHHDAPMCPDVVVTFFLHLS